MMIFRIFLLLSVNWIAETSASLQLSKISGTNKKVDLSKIYDIRDEEVHSTRRENKQSMRVNHYGYVDKNKSIGHEVDTDMNELNHQNGVHLDPIFSSQNVSTVIGQKALLNCRVLNISNKTVSWIRHSDTTLLAIGRLTYTSDRRFKPIHKRFSRDYLLHIRPVRVDDMGWYECQVSTTPPIGHKIYLDVQESSTAILGGKDIFLKEGSKLNLTCLTKTSLHTPTHIFWKHNGQNIVFEDQRSGGKAIFMHNGLDHQQHHYYSHSRKRNLNSTSSHEAANFRQQKLLYKQSRKKHRSLPPSRRGWIESKIVQHFKQDFATNLNNNTTSSASAVDFERHKLRWRRYVIRDEIEGEGMTTEIDSAKISPSKIFTSLSSLIIESVGLRDSGGYMCKPSVGQTAKVQVHVFKGEMIEARTGSDAAQSTKISTISSTNLRRSALLMFTLIVSTILWK